MKILQVVIALVLAAGLLYLARINSEGRPEFVTHTENGFTFEMTTVPKVYENEEATIRVKITGDITPELRLFFRPSRYGQDENTPLRKYQTIPLQLEDSTAGIYSAQVTAGSIGKKLYYYFEIRDNVGGHRASFTQKNGKPFVLKYIGHVPLYVLVGHISLMALTVFFLVIGFVKAIPLLAGKGNAHAMVKFFLLSALSAFVGGYLIGFAMNHYAFGTIWEGVPFGTDATDNKTQLLFVYLLFITIAGFGSLTNGKLGRDVFSQKTLGWLGVGAFILMLVIYLIPHSIQFSPALTYAVCYSFIGFFVLLYLVGWFRTRTPKVKSVEE